MAIVTTPEIARTLKPDREPVLVKALQIAVSSGEEALYHRWDGANILTTRVAAQRAYDEAGISKPREEIDLMEVHEMCIRDRYSPSAIIRRTFLPESKW